jgi:putative aldouronate transport system substrate-binding protein
MKRVKVLAVLLALALVFSFAGCSDKTDTQDNSPTDAQATEKASQEDTNTEDANAGADEVTTYNYFAQYTGSDNWDTEQGFASYVLDTFGLEFVIDNPAEDAMTNLGLMLATGELPEMMSLSDPTMREELIASGEVWDLQELFETYLPDSWILQNFPADVKSELIARDGGWYCFPSHMETKDNRVNYPPNSEFWADLVDFGSNSCVAFNDDIIEALDIDTTKLNSEEGVLEVLELVANSGYTTPDGEAVMPVLSNGSSYQGFIESSFGWSFGALPVDAEGNYQSVYLSEGYKQALKFTNTITTNGWLDTNTLTLDDTATIAYLSSGRAFMYFGNQTLISLEEITNYTSYGPIYAANGAQPTFPKVKVAGTGWLQTLVAKDAEYPEKLAAFIDFMARPEGLFMHFYGTEGEDYNIDENGAVVMTESGQAKRDEYETSTYNNLWAFANTSFERHTEKVPAEGEIRAVEKQLMTAYAKDDGVYIYNQSLLNFPETTIDPTSDLGIAETQIDNYIESQVGAIIIADDFESEYQAMIDQLNDYGIEDIDAAYDVVYKELCERYDDTIENVNAD